MGLSAPFPSCLFVRRTLIVYVCSLSAHWHTSVHLPHLIGTTPALRTVPLAALIDCPKRPSGMDRTCRQTDRQAVCLVCVITGLSACPSLSMSLLACLPCLPTCLSLHLLVSLFVCLLVVLLAFLSTCLQVSLLACLLVPFCYPSLSLPSSPPHPLLACFFATQLACSLV